MDIVETIADMRALRKSWNQERVALVPTMGALHAGHLSLVEKAKTLADKVIVSIYVNPLQFGPHEDYERYPRSLERDLEQCNEHRVDAVFHPSSNEMYPQGLEAVTQVVPPQILVDQLCGLSRPGHFTGVATIVLKLLNCVQPQIAVFGQKDAQQLAVIQHMVRDLNLPVEIVPASTIRESDGLAMSSRNRYLRSASDRQQSRLLSRLLITVQQLYRQGLETTEEALGMAKDQVLDEALYPDFQLEYLAAVNQDTFLPKPILDEDTRILVAARIGDIRLIDNSLLSEALGNFSALSDTTTSLVCPSP